MKRLKDWTDTYSEILTEKKLMNYLSEVSNSKEFQDKISKRTLIELGEMYGCSEQEMIRLIKIEKEKQNELHKNNQSRQNFSSR